MTQPTAIRPPCAAGRFYPDDPQRLLAQLDALLAAAPSSEDASAALAIVSPHAGYRYSGPVAASAFGQLMSRRAAVRRAVVLGPAHFTRLRGMALPRSDAYETPLGAIRVDEPARTLAAALPSVVLSDAAHRGEHSIEVQLPFLQRVLGSEIEIVPVVVGQVEANRVADLIDALWQDQSSAVVVSTDLSRYHDQATASRLDQRTADAIVRRDPAAIGDYDVMHCEVCSSSPVAETSACGRSTYAPPATPLAASPASSATAPSASTQLDPLAPVRVLTPVRLRVCS